MASRKTTKQLQYKIYGGGVSQPWLHYADYSDTKSDSLDLNEDRKHLLSEEACQVRLVFVGQDGWIG